MDGSKTVAKNTCEQNVNNVSQLVNENCYMNTYYLSIDLGRNCSPNSLQNSAKLNTECLNANYSNLLKDHCQFGFKPLGELQLYSGRPVFWNTSPDIFSTHYMIKDSGVLNFMKCRIPVQSNLNPDKWRLYLKKYHDQ